jgi:hypothetical protein
MWDKTKAVEYADSHVLDGSHGKCAAYTRMAIEAGGVTLTHHTSAKDYGSSLTAVGFVKVSADHNHNQAGDVGIVQPITGHPHGHMAIFDGKYWISDFKQLYGLYPGNAYRKAKPSYAIYRYQVEWDKNAPSVPTGTVPKS